MVVCSVGRESDIVVPTESEFMHGIRLVASDDGRFQVEASCGSMLPNRRLSIPNEDFGRPNPFRSPNTVLTTFQSASKMHSETFVRPSKIFVWEGVNVLAVIFATVGPVWVGRSQTEK